MSGIKDLLGDTPFTYPLAPGFKEPTTSRDAARAVSSSAPLLRDRVFAALRLTAMTPDECAAKLGESVLAVRPRFSELSKAERIIETGERRRNQESGLKAKVWRAR